MEYLLLFYDLGISGVPIIVFTEPELVKQFRIFPSSVRVIGVPLDSFETYAKCITYKGPLPKERDTKKDTLEYLSLINTKPEFVKKASELCDDETFMWVDFGMLKSVKDTEKFINNIKRYNEQTFSKVIIPGIWNYGTGLFTDQPNWRFCGCLIFIMRQHIDKFYEYVKTTVNELYEINQLTWEVNVWYMIEIYKANGIIEWYKTDHGNVLIDNIPIEI